MCTLASTSLKPLANNFEQMGMREALQRGVALLEKRVALPEIPFWLCELDFVKACHSADPWAVGDIVQILRVAERQLRSRSASRSASCKRWQLTDPPPETPALPAWAADDENSQKHMVVALGRLALGAAVEAALVEQALDLCAPGARSSGRDAATPRAFNDAFVVAVWTSSHAQYVSYVQSGVEEPPSPGVHSVPNAAAEYDLSDLFARRFCTRLCPKGATPLLQILQRSTNPGSRGWNTLLESALQESMAARVVVGNAMVVAAGGMHPFLHPALRPPWNKRMCAMRVAQHRLTDSEVRGCLVATAAATKESVRRMLASTMQASPAMQAALAYVNHPVGIMLSPPMSMPARGMEAAMSAFVDAGLMMIDTTCTKSYVEVIDLCFHNRKSPAAIEWDPPWLVHQKIPLVSVASDLWSMAFRTNFLVFWAHCMSKKMRASRLDPVQHRAIHGLNTCTTLANSLSQKDQLFAQRAALQHPSAGLLTMEEASTLLGIKGVKGTSSNGGAKNSQDALLALSAAGAAATAKLLVFARAAWVSEELLAVDLGPETTRMQVRALYKRLGRCDYDAGTSCASLLPIHATHLHACIECRRVANAYSVDGVKPGLSFNELGVGSSMLCTECVGDNAGQTNIRCAKRSSAALRTALTFEELMNGESDRVEGACEDSSAVQVLLESNQGQKAASDGADAGDLTGIAARVRRDAKNALEQRATAYACGEQPMLCINIVGKAIRLWNDWFALCSYCGAMLRVLPQSRHGAEICCRKCDAEMLRVTATVPNERMVAVCRFCTAPDTVRSASRWKCIKAPLDVAGENARLPPPLRSVHYCPAHWRTWLSSAHRVLPTRIILSHIAHNAKPIFSTENGRKADDLGLGLPAKSRKRRRGKAGDDAAGETS